MNLGNFDNLPPLSKKEALEILKTPIKKLRISSDYYKAVFHLAKYPDYETEEALLSVLDSNIDHQSINLAKRKAIEILARIGCKRAIPKIALSLKSHDKYLIENAAWALQELDCDDINLHREIGSLLEKNHQDQRVLVQSLGKMKAESQLPKITKLLEVSNSSPSVRGASIAAISRISGKSIYISELQDYLSLPTQTDRLLAVQDIIDAKEVSFLDSVIKAPVSPSFRLRAITDLYKDCSNLISNTKLFSLIEFVLEDKPELINKLHTYKNLPDIPFLVNELFSTDFSQAYSALHALKKKNKNEVWSCLISNLEKIKKDYGALYFLMILLRFISTKDKESDSKIQELIFECLSDNWPDFMKFKPAAIITLTKLYPELSNSYIINWLNEAITPFWACRYSTLFTLENTLLHKNFQKFIPNIIQSLNDTNIFVSQKARSICNRFDLI